MTNSDAKYTVNLSRIAFGSCHSRGAFNKRISGHSANYSTIWDVITRTVQPQAFLWTGDAIYPSMEVKGDTPLDVMHEEYTQMLNNATLGYAKFINDEHLVGGVHGVWDDHDYGGNDRGRELKQREERRDEYLNFLGVSSTDHPRRRRRGLYSSVEFRSIGTPDQSTNADTLRNNTVKVIFLDTRWHREKHCIPSVGSNRYIPHGAILSCVTRWLTAGLDLPRFLPSLICPSQNQNAVLGEDQWIWLEQQLKHSSASVHIIVSSIQVLTSNPVVESWGHFPNERHRLLKLLNNVPGLVILSGDVHHAEISATSNPNKSKMQRINFGSIIEVTSSGLTHSCSGPRLYGPLCEPILDLFPSHRFQGGNIHNNLEAPSYYTGLNFGSIDFNWTSRSFEVKVHNENGVVMLSTGYLGMDQAADMTLQELEVIPKCIDGHFLLMARKLKHPGFIIVASILFCLCILKPKANKKVHSKKD